MKLSLRLKIKKFLTDSKLFSNQAALPPPPARRRYPSPCQPAHLHPRQCGCGAAGGGGENREKQIIEWLLLFANGQAEYDLTCHREGLPFRIRCGDLLVYQNGVALLRSP